MRAWSASLLPPDPPEGATAVASSGGWIAIEQEGLGRSYRYVNDSRVS